MIKKIGFENYLLNSYCKIENSHFVSSNGFKLISSEDKNGIGTFRFFLEPYETECILKISVFSEDIKRPIVLSVKNGFCISHSMKVLSKFCKHTYFFSVNKNEVDLNVHMPNNATVSFSQFEYECISTVENENKKSSIHVWKPNKIGKNGIVNEDEYLWGLKNKDSVLSSYQSYEPFKFVIKSYNYDEAGENGIPSKFLFWIGEFNEYNLTFTTLDEKKLNTQIFTDQEIFSGIFVERFGSLLSIDASLQRESKKNRFVGLDENGQLHKEAVFNLWIKKS